MARRYDGMSERPRLSQKNAWARRVAGSLDPTSLETSYGESGVYLPRILGEEEEFVEGVDRWDVHALAGALNRRFSKAGRYSFRVPTTQEGDDAFHVSRGLKESYCFLNFAEIIDVRRGLVYIEPKPVQRKDGIFPTGETKKVDLKDAPVGITNNNIEILKKVRAFKERRGRVYDGYGVHPDEQHGIASLRGGWAKCQGFPNSVASMFYVVSYKPSDGNETTAGFVKVDNKTRKPVLPVCKAA